MIRFFHFHEEPSFGGIPSPADKLLTGTAIGLAGVLLDVSVAFTQTAKGPIPIHFNVLGEADAWGDPTFYLVLGGLGLLTVGLCLIASRYPQLIHLPVVLRQETAVQKAVKCRYARSMAVVCGALFLSLLLLCRAYETEASWKTAATALLAVSLFAVLVVTITASLHVVRTGKP